jgi:O-acetyl-ADP-ribose deacetylase (regulator of RNase III)
MQTEQGDLVQKAKVGAFDVVGHGCNCFCQMGAGVAKTIKQVFPAAYQAYLTTIAGDQTKLGTYSVAHVAVAGKGLVIINGYTQYQWRGAGLKADYEAIRQVFRGVKQAYTSCRIGYPALGAGLAGGDWAIIAAIIDEELAGKEHVFVQWTK